MNRLLGGGPIRVGDLTSRGGRVIGPGVPFMPIEGKLAITRGMSAICCGGPQVFVEGCHGNDFNGQGLVLEGHRLSCGCHALSTCPMQVRVQDTMPAGFFSAALARRAPDNAAAPARLAPSGWDRGEPLFNQPAVLNTVTVHIGLFFDGTSNNAANADLGAQCREELREEADVEAMEAFCRRYMQSGSYAGAATNVRKLFQLFPDDTGETVQPGQAEYHVRRYVPGIGTSTGEPDSIIRGQAMGEGATGVRRRAEAVLDETIPEAMDDVARVNPNVLVKQIVLHVFGFSRGAAAARHFVALVHQRGIDLCDPLANCRAHYAPGFHPRQHVRIAFVGLFDTVVSVGLDAGTGDPARARARGLEVELPAGCADRVVQLCAREEHRLNFPLTLAGEPPTDLRLLPGVHSDIGGGYAEEAVEELMMIRSLSADMPIDGDPTKTRVYREAEKALPRWRDYVDPQDPDARLEVDVHTNLYRRRDLRSRSAVPQLRRRVTATVGLRRRVSAAYTLVCLRVMHAVAQDAGVPFKGIPMEPQFSLPDDLEAISDKLVAYARSGDDPGLTAEEERLLRRTYLHLSAHWTPQLLPALGPGTWPEAVYIHRPTDDGERVVYRNTGGRAK